MTEDTVRVFAHGDDPQCSLGYFVAALLAQEDESVEFGWARK